MSAAAVFAATEAIRAGEWDDYLHVVFGEIAKRQRTSEYRERIIDRASLRASEPEPEPIPSEWVGQ